MGGPHEKETRPPVQTGSLALAREYRFITSKEAHS